MTFPFGVVVENPGFCTNVDDQYYQQEDIKICVMGQCYVKSNQKFSHPRWFKMNWKLLAHSDEKKVKNMNLMFIRS